MIKSEEKLKNLSSLLEKDNPELVIQAVEMLREEEPFEGAVELLASCYDRNMGIAVQKVIESFMNDLKDKSLRVEVIGELKKEHQPKTMAMLVSSCWQSGLDYSAFSQEFAEVFLKSDYGTALECLTVIEESIHVLTQQEKENILELVREYTAREKGAKKTLALELIARLES